MKESPETETIRGTIHRVTFRNAANGYSVIQVTLDTTSDRITAVGICPQSKVGSHVLMTGTFVAHPKFGRQFNLLSLTATPPSTPDGIERYLSSGLIAGVGKKTAKRIVDTFGAATLEVIRTDPSQVAAVTGVGRKKAELLHSALAQQSEFDQIMQFLIEHNISPSLSAKIYERFHAKTIESIRSDPYVLAREVRGIGFQTADSIALKIGIAKDSHVRIRAGLLYALESASDEGHCYLSRKAIFERAQQLLGVEDTSHLTEQLEHLISIQALHTYQGGIFLKRFDMAEDSVARFVAGRTAPKTKGAEIASLLRESVSDAEKVLGVSLSAEQRYAVELAASYPLLIITGGPGCGKTTMIKALTVLFERTGLSFALAAPTGRAAQRMSQVCGAPASTIHRLLKYEPLSKGFVHNAQNPLPLDALIIDEASMIDILLARDLFASLSERCTLILVGDKDQLPSVGPGRVFGDLVRCRDVKVIQLSQLFRRSAESTINTVAHMINVGEVPHIPSPDGVTKSDAYFIERGDTQEAATLIEGLVAEQIPRKFGLFGVEIAVLTPTNRGPLGTLELNRKLQERLNPRAQRADEEILELGDNNLRVGDRVCQRVNNYKIDPSGVFNGDMGSVVRINREDQTITVEMWDGRLINYSRVELGQLSLAYAVTVHRSQGMEVPCVVLALDDSHFTLLERQLVYTGVTRAKKLLIIVGSKRALMMATKRTQTKKRCTLLLERITEINSPAETRYIPLDEDNVFNE